MSSSSGSNNNNTAFERVSHGFLFGNSLHAHIASSGIVVTDMPARTDKIVVMHAGVSPTNTPVPAVPMSFLTKNDEDKIVPARPLVIYVMCEYNADPFDVPSFGKMLMEHYRDVRHYPRLVFVEPHTSKPDPEVTDVPFIHQLASWLNESTSGRHGDGLMRGCDILDPFAGEEDPSQCYVKGRGKSSNVIMATNRVLVDHMGVEIPNSVGRVWELICFESVSRGQFRAGLTDMYRMAQRWKLGMSRFVGDMSIVASCMEACVGRSHPLAMYAGGGGSSSTSGTRLLAVNDIVLAAMLNSEMYGRIMRIAHNEVEAMTELAYAQVAQASYDMVWGEDEAGSKLLGRVVESENGITLSDKMHALVTYALDVEERSQLTNPANATAYQFVAVLTTARVGSRVYRRVHLGGVYDYFVANNTFADEDGKARNDKEAKALRRIPSAIIRKLLDASKQAAEEHGSDMTPEERAACGTCVHTPNWLEFSIVQPRVSCLQTALGL